MTRSSTIPSLRFATLAAALALPCVVHAAGDPPITWSPTTGTNIAGDSDVITAGSPVVAFNFGTTGVSSVAVNGVTFAPFAVIYDDGPGTTTIGGVSLTFTNRLAFNTAFGSASTPFSNLSTDYQTLLSAGVTDNNGSFNMAISGLTNGQMYLIQWWANSATSNIVNFNGTTTATSTNALTLQDNANQTEGSAGQFGVGTFTAGPVGQESVTFTGFRPLLNALQIRAVPEASTPGDFNRDGHVNAADILPAMKALTNPVGYEAQYGVSPADLPIIGDVNDDGSFNNADLQYLLTTLKSGGGSTDSVPEPASWVLAFLALTTVSGTRLCVRCVR
jgi:hypothetical protein